MKELLRRSLLKRHFSFNIWTSLNCKPILAVVTHFLSYGYEGRYEVLSLLLDMRELYSAYNGIEIIRVIIEIFVDQELNPIEIRVSVSDNVSNNNITIKEVVS